MNKTLSRRELLVRFAVSVLVVSAKPAFSQLQAQSAPPKPQPKPGKKEAPPPASKEPIAEKVRQIIIKNLGVEGNKVIPSARFCEDLGADSLDFVELIMSLEETFDLTIPDKDAEKLRTVRDIVDYVKAHRKPPSPRSK